MIQVLHVLCDFNIGGAEKFVHHLCQAYPSHIYPKVCTLYSGGELEEEFRNLGIPLLQCQRLRRRLDLRAMLRLARWMTESDIVHTHLFAGHFWGRISAQIANLSAHPRPLVSTFHNTQADTPFRGWLLQQSSALSQINVGISQAVTATLPPNSPTIYSGIPLAPFAQLKRTPVPGRILSIGRLVEQKGFDILAQSVRIAKQRQPNIQAHVLGTGPLFQALDNTDLKLLGHHNDIRSHLQEADIFVLPTRWEGLGIVFLEAMAAGVPIITSDLPICREICGDAALYVPTERPTELAAQIIWLMQNVEAKEKLRLNGIKRSQQFSIDESARQYTALYEQLIAEGT